MALDAYQKKYDVENREMGERDRHSSVEPVPDQRRNNAGRAWNGEDHALAIDGFLARPSTGGINDERRGDKKLGWSSEVEELMRCIGGASRSTSLTVI